LAHKIVDNVSMEITGQEIVKRIDSVLKQKNLKRQAVADAVGISTQSFTHWSMRGSVLAADTAIKIAQFLDVSVEWLITGQDPNGLSEEDRSLLSKWHELAAAAKETVMMMIDALLEKARKSSERISS
jgi:transcriptional regulator with XRE-family HTH domain